MRTSAPNGKRPARAGSATARELQIADPAVASVFQSYPGKLKARLLSLRRLILATAAATPGVGAVEETLKWGQPSYLTAATGSGSTIRIDRVRPESKTDAGDRYALYFHCQTGLVATFRELYSGTLTFGGNRSILLAADQPVPREALRHCIALALTYHLKPARHRP
jgi:hypothetical protein